ncbi:MAG: D-alanine--D-alanine ligase [Clostridiales bacterium]|nr:D-alanine--D-alanine ligase [Clostridiales bacterium]
MKTRIAVLFGGRSVEHEVSIITGLQVYAALDRHKYEPIPLYISKEGLFYTGGHMGEIESYRDMKACLQKATQVVPVPGENHTVDLLRQPPKRFGNPVVATFDAALPAVHGTNVEDGVLSGFLETLNVPYAGCDVLSSALGMDKYQMKAVLRQAGIPVLDAVSFTGREYALYPDAALERAERVGPYPLIVKPVNLGSSVGVSRAGDRPELEQAIDEALRYSGRVLVERAVPHLREINCAVLGDYETAEASVCEEPVGSDEILSYQDKYLSGSKKTGTAAGGKSGMSSLQRRLPAEIPDELAERVQELSVRTFRALNCLGVSRIDFLNDRESGELWVNEINTIPGSLAFYLWEASGVPFAEMLERMLDAAFKRQRERAALTFTYDTNLLSGVELGGAKGSKR